MNGDSYAVSPRDEPAAGQLGAASDSHTGSAAAPEMRRLDPAVRNVWRLSGLIWMGVFGFGALVLGTYFGFSGRPSPLVGALVLAALAILSSIDAFLLTEVRYRLWRYAVRPHDVLVYYGVVWKVRRCIPRPRIQHVDITSGPIDRAFGLSSVSLFTAGNIAAVVTIPGLKPADAEALREELLAAEARRV